MDHKQVVSPIIAMAQLPDFHPDEQYQIKVCKPVLIGGEGGVWLRPSSTKIVVSGETAQSLGDAVVWAIKQ